MFISFPFAVFCVFLSAGEMEMPVRNPIVNELPSKKGKKGAKLLSNADKEQAQRAKAGVQ